VALDQAWAINSAREHFEKDALSGGPYL